MNRSLTSLFDFFLPRICPGCNKKLLSDEEPVCKECLRSILIADKEKLEYEYQKNFSSSKIVNDFYSKYIFETDKTLQHIIHALKYQKQYKLGIFLGEIISTGVLTRNWNIDFIVPVPIHRVKKAERGYNQSDYIAKGLSKSLGIPYSTKLIKRIRQTESQTLLHINERTKNVAGAFKVTDSNKISGKTFLLVDDVITTGATILECAKTLDKENAKTVYACSIGTTSLEDSTSSQEL